MSEGVFITTSAHRHNQGVIMKEFVEVKTTDNTTVLLRIDQIAGIEEIPSSQRSEGYLKLYVAGYSFGVKIDLEEFKKKIES